MNILTSKQNYITFLHKPDVNLCTKYGNDINMHSKFSQTCTQMSSVCLQYETSAYLFVQTPEKLIHLKATFLNIWYVIHIWVYVFIKRGQSIQKALQKRLFNKHVACLPRNHSSPPLKIHKIHPPHQSHFTLISHRPQRSWNSFFLLL